MLHVPSLGTYQWYLPTHNVRPASAMGVTLTPGNNTMGSWGELIDGALVTTDVWYIEININSGGASTAARSILIDIGIDPTAGTSYSVVIPYLVGTQASTYITLGGGIWYGFPLHIPAGSSIAARASVNNATVGTVNVQAFLYGKPKYPEVTWKGQGVEQLGAVTGTSTGTTVTSGTTSEGSWTSLGSPTHHTKWVQLGFSNNDSGLGTNVYHAELAAGDGSNKHIIMPDIVCTQASTELWSYQNRLGACSVPESATIYGRLQCSGTADTGTSMVAYCVY